MKSVSLNFKADRKQEKRGARFLKFFFIFLASSVIVYSGAKASEAFRLSPGSGVLEKISSFPVGVNHAVTGRFFPSYFSDYLAGAVFLFLAWAGVYFRYVTRGKNFRFKNEYGSARWGDYSDIKPYINPDFRQNIILTKTERLTVESRPKNPEYSRNKNVLVIGGSGSGKTRSFIIPNIMQMNASYVVTDTKGDIVTSVGKMLKDSGYDIKVFNTADFGKSMHYNPFAYIKSETDIMKLVGILISNTKGEGKTGDDFWIKAETLLYTALIGYIVTEVREKERNFATLVDFISSLVVKEEDESFKNNVDKMFDELEKRNPDSFALRQYKKYKLAAGKTAKSINVSCGVRLAPFDIGAVREITSYDELSLGDLGGTKKKGKNRKTALFLIISDTDDTFNFLVSMIYSQLFNILCTKADNEFDGRLPVHVRCLIDECANIGKIPNLERLMAVIRSREISACLALQARSQLKTLYGDSAETIIGNCDSILFLGGTEPSTLEDISKALGKETIDIMNTSENRGRDVSHGMSYQKTGKELASRDELAVMSGNRCILQLRGVRPFLSEKYDIHDHPFYGKLAEAGKNNRIDLDSLVHEKKEDDENEVEMFAVKV